jgi:hypothetical protein
MYLFETCSLTLREEPVSQVFKKRGPRNMFGSKKDEISE